MEKRLDIQNEIKQIIQGESGQAGQQKVGKKGKQVRSLNEM